jgi:hypothetical protein
MRISTHEPGFIFVLQTEGNIPVMQCLMVMSGQIEIEGGGDTYHEGGYVLGQERIYELVIVLEALFVHGIVATAHWDDARPREGKAIGITFECLQ